MNDFRRAEAQSVSLYLRGFRPNPRGQPSWFLLYFGLLLVRWKRSPFWSPMKSICLGYSGRLLVFWTPAVLIRVIAGDRDSTLTVVPHPWLWIH